MKSAEKLIETGLVVREQVEADEITREGDDVAHGRGLAAPSTTGREYAPAVITQAWKMAINGIRNVVCFGSMLCEVDTSLSRETSKRTDPRGGVDTLKGWLAEHCPEINYKTAMKFRRMAEITIAAAQTEYGAEIGAGETVELLGLLPHKGEEISDSGEAKRIILERFLDGKSQRDVLQLWAEGGAKPGRVKGSPKPAVARQKKSDEEILAAAQEEAAQALMTARNCLRALTTDLGGHLNPISARSLLIDIRNDIKVIAAGLES